MGTFLGGRWPSPAMAVAFVALLAALSGTAIALPDKNTVDSGDIKNGQVKGKDIGKNAVNAAKVANGTLTGADVKDKSLTASDFSGSVQGPQGSQGAQGPQGPQGAQGPPGNVDAMSSFFHRLSGGETVTLLEHGTITIVAECLDNQTVQGQANQDAVRMLVSTSQDGALMVADSGDFHDGFNGDFLNVNTPVDERELYVWRLSDGEAVAASNIDSLSVVDPNGRVITSFGGEGFVAGVNLLGSACYLGGTFLTIA
jgi:hypothetical protein